MKQSELNRAVARATGETVATVKRLGFIIADPCEELSTTFEDQLGPEVIDWDALDLVRRDCNLWGPRDEAATT